MICIHLYIFVIDSFIGLCLLLIVFVPIRTMKECLANI